MLLTNPWHQYRCRGEIQHLIYTNSTAIVSLQYAYFTTPTRTKQDKTVLSCLVHVGGVNDIGDKSKTVGDRKLRDCFIKYLNAVRTTEKCRSELCIGPVKELNLNNSKSERNNRFILITSHAPCHRRKVVLQSHLFTDNIYMAAK